MEQTLSVILTTPTALSAPGHRPIAPPATPPQTAARLTDRQTSRSSRTRLLRLKRRLPAYQGQEGRWRRIRQLGVSCALASDLDSRWVLASEAGSRMRDGTKTYLPVRRRQSRLGELNRRRADESVPLVRLGRRRGWTFPACIFGCAGCQRGAARQ